MIQLHSRGAGRLIPARLGAGLLVLCLGTGSVAAGQETRPASPSTTSCQESIPDLFTRVSPAVVSISAMRVNPYDLNDRMDRVSGSGVLIDASGLILTNSHVVFGRQVITVTLDDGTTLPARVVGADPIYDIALLRVPPPAKGALPTARLGDSEHVRVGEEVYAIGNPFGLDQTLTRGVVSAVNRLLPGDSWSLTEPLIQTDAAINPGNSGGPIVNRCGDIVGITTALLPGAQSIGFAVPANLIKTVIPLLTDNGRVIRPWLGVQGQVVAPVLKDLLRVPLTDGFLVEVVEPGSPAEKAGISGGGIDLTIGEEPFLVGGDIITEVNGAAVADADSLTRALETLQIGAPVRLTIFREKQIRHLEVVITERPLLPGDVPGSCTTALDGGAAQPSPARVSRSARRAF